VRLTLYIAACVVGLVLALLGADPLIGVLVVAIVLYPLATGVIIRADSRARDRSAPALLPALLAGLTGTLLVFILIRLAIAAPDWVDPLSADCEGPSTGTQQIATWFAAVVFVLSAIPEAVTVVAVGRRLRSTSTLELPVSLGFFPIAVAFSGLALIIVSFATTC
jgi:hypothetical protein